MCPYSCGGHGSCNSVTGKCFNCYKGWNSPNCITPVQTLEVGNASISNITLGNWAYFSVELNEISYLEVNVIWIVESNLYPLVFLKEGTYPTYSVYDLADINPQSPSKRIILYYPSPGIWYIGVTTSPQSGLKRDITQNSCAFNISISNSNGTCYNQCNGRGKCKSNGKCECYYPYSGVDCSLSDIDLKSNITRPAVISQGEFQYYRLPLKDLNNVVISFLLTLSLKEEESNYNNNYQDIGDGIHTDKFPLFVKKNSRPTLYDYDYVCTDKIPCELNIYIPEKIDMETWYIGVWGIQITQPPPYSYYLFHTIIESPCPNNCSNNGNCTLGNCTCNTNYQGPDCSDFVAHLEEETIQVDNISEDRRNYIFEVYQQDISFYITPLNYSGKANYLDVIVNYNTSGDVYHYYYKRECLIDLQKPCIIELYAVNIGDWYISLKLYGKGELYYSITAMSDTLCPNHCSYHGNCNPDATCGCYSTYNNSDCSVSYKPATLNGQTILTISANEWIYLYIDSINIKPNLLIVNNVNNDNAADVTPMNLYIRAKDIPQELTYDAKVSSSQGLNDIGQQLILTNVSNQIHGTWYIGIQAPSNIQNDTDITLFLYSKCSNNDPEECKCSDPHKIGSYCNYPYTSIDIGNTQLGKITSQFWNYYWVNIETKVPVVIILEEKVTQEIAPKGLLWLFVRKDYVPYIVENDYWNTSISQLHTINIPSENSIGNWSIGITSSTHLLNNNEVDYNVVVIIGCSAYSDSEVCISDIECMWCYNSWNDLSGVCISTDQDTSLCIEVIDTNHTLGPMIDSQLQGAMIGLGIGTTVIILGIVAIITLWRYNVLQYELELTEAAIPSTDNTNLPTYMDYSDVGNILNEVDIGKFTPLPSVVDSSGPSSSPQRIPGIQIPNKGKIEVSGQTPKTPGLGSLKQSGGHFLSKSSSSLTSSNISTPTQHETTIQNEGLNRPISKLVGPVAVDVETDTVLSTDIDTAEGESAYYDFAPKVKYRISGVKPILDDDSSSD